MLPLQPLEHRSGVTGAFPVAIPIPDTIPRRRFTVRYRIADGSRVDNAADAQSASPESQQPTLESFMRGLAVSFLLLVPSALRAADGVAELHVDLTEVTRKVVHTHLVLPVAPGPQTLYYPKWIPGTHGPIGPVSEQTGLRIKAGGKSLTWKRDDEDPYAYHVTVPEGITSIEASFDSSCNRPAPARGWAPRSRPPVPSSPSSTGTK